MQSRINRTYFTIRRKVPFRRTIERTPGRHPCSEISKVLFDPYYHTTLHKPPYRFYKNFGTMIVLERMMVAPVKQLRKIIRFDLFRLFTSGNSKFFNKV